MTYIEIPLVKSRAVDIDSIEYRELPPEVKEMMRKDFEEDKYNCESKSVDCGKGKTNGCGGRCCKLWFGLSPQDLDEGFEYEKDFPYEIKKGEDGFCIYFDRRSLQCVIWESRPITCRQYSCDGDERIWEGGVFGKNGN